MELQLAYDGFLQQNNLELERIEEHKGEDVVMVDMEQMPCRERAVNLYCDAARIKNVPLPWGKSCTVIRARPSGLKEGVAQFCRRLVYFVALGRVVCLPVLPLRICRCKLLPKTDTTLSHCVR